MACGGLMKNLFFEIKENSISYDGQFTYENDRCIIAFEGEIYLDGSPLSAIQLAELLLAGASLDGIDGLYSLIAYRKDDGLLIATQDIFSYFHPLYFAKTDGGIIISLSMRELILRSGILPKMNDVHIPEFLYNGFMTDDRCLLHGVRKLPAMHLLRYGCLTREGSYLKKNYQPKSPVKKSDDYLSLLRESVEERIASATEINLALSSGFDSNLLLHMITSINPDCRINAFCIGACNGSDEIDSVRRICRSYPQVSLSVKRVSPDILEELPSMVYELEDSVFERGIFLQYMLSCELAGSSHVPTFFGEGADQILSSELRLAAAPYYFVGREQHYPWVYYPYEMLTYIIIKKNGSFMRNRDVISVYPFLSSAFIDGVRKYSERNGSSKEHYKKYVCDLISPEISGLLVKRAGSTNLTSLFDDENRDRLFDAAVRSRFYPMLTAQPDRDSGSEVHMDNCLKILYLECFERIFCKRATDLKDDKCTLKLSETLCERTN